MIEVYFLGHSGFAVETENHFLIFDYYKTKRHLAKDGLPEGILPLSKLKNKKNVTVFVSHEHYDHYNPIIFNWEKSLSNIQYVLSSDIEVHKNALMVSPNQTYELDDMQIYTLKSTDKGVAFVVRVDGLTIYHAGDLNNWAWRKESRVWLLYMKVAYEKQIRQLSETNIDLAFVPVDSKLKDNMLMGIDFFVKTVPVKYVIPMHTRLGNLKVARMIKKSDLSSYYYHKIMPPMRRGSQIKLFL